MHRIVDGIKVPLSEAEVAEIEAEWAARRARKSARVEVTLQDRIRAEILKMKEEGLI